jgi:HEAT repeat protein
MPLIAALKDPAKEVRGVAVQALGNLKDKRALEPLLGLTRDRTPEVRFFAIQALVRLGYPKVNELIAAGLNDKDQDVRNSFKEYCEWLANAQK